MKRKTDLERRYGVDLVVPIVMTANTLKPEPVPHTLLIPYGADGETQRVTFDLRPWTVTDQKKAEKAGVPLRPKDHTETMRWARWIVRDSGMIARFDTFRVPMLGQGGEIKGHECIDDTPGGREKLLQVGCINLLQALWALANELTVRVWTPPPLKREEIEAEIKYIESQQAKLVELREQLADLGDEEAPEAPDPTT